FHSTILLRTAQSIYKPARPCRQHAELPPPGETPLVFRSRPTKPPTQCVCPKTPQGPDMPQNASINRRFVLAAHRRGPLQPTNCRLAHTDVPARHHARVLLRTLALSQDPYMRSLMDEVGPAYAAPVPLGEPKVGVTASRVVEFRPPQLRPGVQV